MTTFLSFIKANPWRAAMLVLSLLGGGERGYRVYEWKEWVDQQGWKLNEPVVRFPDGRVLTRKEAIDFIIAQAVENAKREAAQPK